VAGAPPDDRRPAALASAGREAGSRNQLAAFDFPDGSLVLTEAGTKRRASLHVVRGEDALRAVDPAASTSFAADLDAFRRALSVENRTLKRALTDPRIASGIGNAYSDEILHAAGLSPIALTHKLTPQEWERLYTATRATLQLWIDRLRDEAEGGFPEGVTAFARTWPSTGVSANRVRAAASPCSAFDSPTTKRTIARAVRPRAGCSLTAACRGC